MLDASRILQNSWLGVISLMMFLITFGCSNDFNPNLEVESIPVIYGIINPDDSIYSINLSKVFRADSAIDLSKNHGIQYFNDAKVELELLNADGRLLNRAELHPTYVDQEVSGSGLLSPSPKLIYSINREEISIDSDFDPKRTLILKVSTPEFSKLIYSQAQIRRKFSLVNPPEKVHRRWLDFYTEFNESIRWFGWPDDYFEVTLIVNYTDFFIDSSWVEKSVEFGFDVPPTANPENGQVDISYRIDGELFLQKTAKAFREVGTPDSLDYRKFRTIDIQVVSSSSDYYKYIYALNHDSDVSVIQTFNIVNGIGIFATKRVAKSTGHFLQWNVLDSLASSDITKSLKFLKWY
jgi:hypothetical protein